MVQFGFQPILAEIAEMDSGSFKRAAGAVLEQHMQKVQEDVSRYPPANSPTYVRTNTLFQSWHRETIEGGDEINVVVYNDAIDKYGRFYSKWVHGDETGQGQRALHAGNGWVNLIRTHQARRSQLIDAATAAVTAALKAARWL